jgi:hypothetical protein
VNLSTVPPKCCTTAAQRSASSVMISRSRSGPTAAAMSMEWTTSAKAVFGAPVALEFGGSSVPHDPPRWWGGAAWRAARHGDETRYRSRLRDGSVPASDLIGTLRCAYHLVLQRNSGHPDRYLT